ncbi:MAG: type VI secretion system-associated FHA domain protein TagH [Acidobacteriota bacterium]
MHLLIRAVSLAGQPLTQAISAYFDERGGTIGRADTNTLALPDPERRISRLQAEVVLSADGYNIFNVGNANPIWQNEKAIGPGEGALLNEGDELLIGSYALQVSLSRNDETARSITQGRPAVDGRTVIVNSGQDPKTDPSLMTPIAGLDTQAPGVTPRPPMPPVPPVPSAPPSMPAAPVSPSSPFADLLGGMAAAPTPSPFDDLLAPSPAVSSGPSPVMAPAPSPSAPVTRLPDDFDPFADLLGPAKAAPTPPTAPRLPGDLDLMAELNPGGAPSSLDQIFGLSGSPQADPLADFLKKTEPPASQAAVGAPSSVDPLALLSPSAAPASASQPQGEPPLQMPLPDTTPEILGSMPLPAPKPAPSLAEQLAQRMAESAQHVPDGLSPPAVPSASETVAAVSAPVPPPPLVDRIVTISPMPPEAKIPPAERPIPQVSVRELPPAEWTLPTSGLASDTPAAVVAPSALWAAFCEGAGVSFVPPQGLNPDLMRVMGQLLRHSVDGTLRLVAARAATKQEMRAEVTVIQARRNNPLKFSPDTQSAMEQLLQPPLRGFMSGPEAVDDAMDDLLGHTIGTMAGMRAALEGVLARFEPDQLEAKLVGRSMLDSLLPMNRRAKLWELYLQHYGAVSTEAKDDFHNLFGKAFLQAYEEQLDRLDAERRAQKAQGAQGPAA